ncbi:hypothetical protein AB0B60_26120, partial [Streptomyces lincolnensis]|uniref:hypothetical protein n=1 Tax=Streptomyces lincolnensis TaxID=1915 RepID=UPI0033DE8784
ANPLLLTMIANVHRYRGQLPGSRAELYAEMCDAPPARPLRVRAPAVSLLSLGANGFNNVHKGCSA